MAIIQLTQNRNSKRVIASILGFAALIVIMNIGYWTQQINYLLGFTEESTVLSSVRMDPNTIVIPRFNIQAPIIFTSERDEENFQKALREGVVHYPGTAHIGEKGNAFIFGHSSDYIWSTGNYKTVFALLPKIQKEDLILASDNKGTLFTYKVIDTKIVSPNQVEYLDQYEYKKELLTIQTSYPIGTALKRFLVIAELQ